MPAAVVNTSTDGDILVAAPSQSMGVDRRIVILGFDLTSVEAVIVSLKSGSTVLWTSNAMNNSTGGGIEVPISNDSDMMCAAGVALTIGLSAAKTVKGTIRYAIR